MNIYEAVMKQGGSASQLSQLTDVELTNLEDGQSLIWDETNSKWKNSGGSSAGTPEALGIGYGTCTTASATSAKVASLTDYELVKNGIVSVAFTNAVTGASTLNINSKGAKNIMYRGTAITAGVISAGDIASFAYDGTSYHLLAVNKNYPSYRSATLAAGSTSVTFTGIPTTGNNVINVYTSKAGLDYRDIDDSTSGTLVLYFDAQPSAVTVYLKIEVF